MKKKKAPYGINELQKLFGKRVRLLRERQGLTQEELGSKAGLHETFIGQVERGERNLSFLNIMKLADSLKVFAGELFQWSLNHEG